MGKKLVGDGCCGAVVAGVVNKEVNKVMEEVNKK